MVSTLEPAKAQSKTSSAAGTDCLPRIWSAMVEPFDVPLDGPADAGMPFLFKKKSTALSMWLHVNAVIAPS
jgi:hypothetical protein